MSDINYLWIAGAAGAGAIAGGLIVWLEHKAHHEREKMQGRVAELEKQIAGLLLKSAQPWTAEVRLSAQQGLENVARLNTQALRDLLDSTNQLSPRMVVEALRASQVLETLKVLFETGMLK